MAELPERVIERAERLTRLARNAVDDDEAATYRADRAALLGDTGFAARVRNEGPRDVLVLHPEEWVEEGTVRVDRVEDTDRAVEIPLDGPGAVDDWDEVDAHNRDVADEVREAHGDIHGTNAETFADFMSNHYARPVESATGEEIREFLSEYFQRNAWPSDEQRAAVDESIVHVFETVGERPPDFDSSD